MSSFVQNWGVLFSVLLPNYLPWPPSPGALAVSFARTSPDNPSESSAPNPTGPERLTPHVLGDRYKDRGWQASSSRVVLCLDQQHPCHLRPC